MGGNPSKRLDGEEKVGKVHFVERKAHFRESGGGR